MTLRRPTTRAKKYYCMIIEIRSNLRVLFLVFCISFVCVRPTCYFCDVKRMYWNWNETLDIVVPVGLLLAVAVAKKTNILLNQIAIGK